MTAIPPLFAGLCDDAAMFPPGNAPAAVALAEHRRHRTSWYAGLVGPLLAADGHLAAVAEALDGAPDPVVLVVPGGADALPPALGAARTIGLPVSGVELGPGNAVIALGAWLPAGAGGVVEVRRGADLEPDLDLLAGTPYRAKLRTGGTVAESFPEPVEVARFLLGCVRRGLAFKCTAGLHRAVRHTDPATGFTHHGFLNILAATRAAHADDPAAALRALLSQDGAELVSLLYGLTDDQIRLTRASFTAFGTCSVAEPLADLIGLGLITAPTPTEPE